MNKIKIGVLLIILLTFSGALGYCFSFCIRFFGIETVSQATVLILTFIILYFAYFNWTSPRSKVIGFNCSKDGTKFSIKLKNVGLSEGTFRVRVWIDSNDPFPDGNDFINSLFAQIPVAAPWQSGAYPKRTKIARGDFRQFSNFFHWVNKDANEIITLPVGTGKHTVRFEVQQTGENFIFTYISDGENIDLNSINLEKSYGGKYITGYITKKMNQF